MSEREVQVPCLCPDGGHGEEGDTITLRETLDYAAVRAVRYAGAIAREEDPESSIASLMAVMNEGFILHGIESWTLRDAKRKPLELDRATIRQYVLGNLEAALVIGDYADALYQPLVLHPLAALAKRWSQPSPTNGSTSAPTELPSMSPDSTEASNGASSIHSEKRPRRSKRSSTTSTPMDSIEATSDASAGAYTS